MQLKKRLVNMFRISEILEENKTNKRGASSQKELAELLTTSSGEPVSKQYISNIINERQNASIKVLQNIAIALGVPMWQLFESPKNICGNKGNDFNALIEFHGNLYKASSISELERLIADWKGFE